MWKKPKNILTLLVDANKLILRLQKLKMLQQLVRAKKQLELEGVDTSSIFNSKLADKLKNG